MQGRQGNYMEKKIISREQRLYSLYALSVSEAHSLYAIMNGGLWSQPSFHPPFLPPSFSAASLAFSVFREDEVV